MAPRHDPRTTRSAHIGRGARSEVVVVERAPSEFIARKRLAAHVASDPDARASVFVEADALSRIDHPGVVRLVGGDAAAGVLDLSLVEGISIDALVARGPLPASIALHVVRRACAAVSAAHRPRAGAPIVHADLCTENLLVDMAGDVVLIDFDLARAPNTPRPRGYFGHLGTASPEVVRGEPIDTSSDVFSLGVLLWELVVGERLFFRASLAATLQAIGAFEGLEADLARATALLPALEPALARALHPDRAARPPDAEALAALLPAEEDPRASREALALGVDEDTRQRWASWKALASSAAATS